MINQLRYHFQSLYGLRLISCLIAILGFAGLSFGETRYIGSSAELQDFLSGMNTGRDFESDTIIITSDIAYQSVSAGTRTFKGELDGNGYRISGLSQVLFSRNEGVIKNLHFSSGTISGGADVAALCINNYGTIVSCSSNVNVSGSSEDYMHVGGLCSYNYGQIIDCINSGNITCTLNNWSKTVTRCGGITAYSDGSIIYCENKGKVATNGVYSSLTGGITGDLQQGEIIGCTNRGEVYSYLKSASPTDWISQTYQLQYTGGITGQAQVNSKINRCRNYAYVSSNFQYVGGIAGQVSRTSIYNTVNYGKIESFEGVGYACAAGIVGYSHGVYDYVDFYNCINHGDIVSVAKYDIATAAGVAMELTKCFVANCYSDGSVSAQRTGGTGTQAFTIPQYDYEDSEIKSSPTTPEEANRYISTLTNPDTPLLEWCLNNGKYDLKDGYLSFPAARHGDCNIYIFPKDAAGPFYLTYTSKESGERFAATAFSSSIYIDRLLPDSKYDYQISFPREEYIENNSFVTAKPVITFDVSETSYDWISFSNNCASSGISDFKSELVINDNSNAPRIVSLSHDSNTCVANNLEEDSSYDFHLVYTLNGKSFSSAHIESETRAVEPVFSVEEVTPYSIRLKCDNYDELKRFSPRIFLDSYLSYSSEGAVEAGPKSFYSLTDDGIIEIDNLQYDYDVPVQSEYVFNGDVRHRSLAAIRTAKWGGEGIIQVSPRAAMVHGLFGGLGEHIPGRSNSYIYKTPLFTYRDALSADSELSTSIEGVAIDGNCDFAVTIPLSSPLYQYFIRLKSNQTYYGNYLYKNGEWNIIEASAPNVDIVTPRFYYPEFSNKTLSISFINGEETTSEIALEYQIEGAYPTNLIVLSELSQSQRLSKQFTTLVPNLSYLFRYYSTTENGKRYYSSIYRLKDGALEEVSDTSMLSVSKIMLSESSICIQEGAEFTLTATVLPGLAYNKDVEWVSSNPLIASVSADGLVSAHEQGQCVVSAYSTDGSEVMASCEVAVMKPVSEIVLDVSDITIHEGQSIQLEATVLPVTADNKSLEWSSGDESIAVVTQEGIITAVKRGSAVVTVTSKDGSEVTASCYVNVIRPVTDIMLDRSEVRIGEGYSMQLSAKMLPTDADVKDLVWESSDDNVATVNQNGLIKALSPGYVAITATSTDGSNISAVCEVEVARLVSDIILTPSPLNMRVGETAGVTVRIVPEDATYQNVYWQSLEPEIVSVDDNGVVHALSVGDAFIMAYASDWSEVFGECYVSVSESAGIATADLDSVKVYSVNGAITIENVPSDTVIRIFQPSGVELFNTKVTEGVVTFRPANAGVYFVMVGSEAYTVLVK